MYITDFVVMGSTYHQNVIISTINIPLPIEQIEADRDGL